MRKTSNIELSLYDPTDTFDITGSSNSLNHNMEIIDQKFSDTPNSSDIEKVNKDIGSLKVETGSLKEDLGTFYRKVEEYIATENLFIAENSTDGEYIENTGTIGNSSMF